MRMIIGRSLRLLNSSRRMRGVRGRDDNSRKKVQNVRGGSSAEQTTVRDVESRHSASDASGSAHRAKSSGSRSVRRTSIGSMKPAVVGAPWYWRVNVGLLRAPSGAPQTTTRQGTKPSMSHRST
jgi:hypothetical protein